MSAKKPKNTKGTQGAVERFPPPDIENLKYDENYMFECALKNEYKNVCGALDAKEHPLSTYVIENNLFNKRDGNGKTCFDLSAYLGNKEFIRTILERTGDRLDENMFNLRGQIKTTNSYNFMHYACVWGRLDLCKYLAENSKMIIDPSLDITQIDPKNLNLPAYNKTLGSILLKTKAKTGETPKQLAQRYDHHDLVEYLNYAEKRQAFVDYINDTKLISNDPEKNLNKLSKDDKKKLDQICSSALEWIDKNKENTEIKELESKVKETEAEIKLILAKIHEEAVNIPPPSRSGKEHKATVK